MQDFVKIWDENEVRDSLIRFPFFHRHRHLSVKRKPAVIALSYIVRFEGCSICYAVGWHGATSCKDFESHIFVRT